jgi:hypothetical protein
MTMRSYARRTVVQVAALIIGLAGSVVAVSATPAHADPIDCTPTVGGWPGYQTFTLHIDANPCRVPIRAWAECDQWGTATGSATSANTGTSVADCGWIRGVDPYGEWGYDIYTYGAWHRYDMRVGQWQS